MSSSIVPLYRTIAIGLLSDLDFLSHLAFYFSHLVFYGSSGTMVLQVALCYPALGSIGETAMLGRVDYVRIRVGGSLQERAEKLARFNDLAEELVQKHGIEGKPYEGKPNWDRSLKEWTYLFNIWGEAADYFYNAVNIGAFSGVTRLDYRVEATNPLLDLELVGRVAAQKAKGRLSIARLDGVPKSKRGGRDTGGGTVAVGGKDSDRRVSIYNRGKHVPAVEAQIASRLVRQLVKTSYDLSVEKGVDFRQVLYIKLEEELNRLCDERLGWPLEAFVEETKLNSQSDAFNHQESLLVQADWIWSMMDNEAKVAFIETKASELAEPVVNEVEQVGSHQHLNYMEYSTPEYDEPEYNPDESDLGLPVEGGSHIDEEPQYYEDHELPW